MRLGHIHLRVASLERSEQFYTELLGLKVTERVKAQYSFLSFGQSHHDLALRVDGSRDVLSLAESSPLAHVAFEARDHEEFATIVTRLRAIAAPYTLVDYGISWALYTQDPDGNTIEVYLDRRSGQGGTKLWNGRSKGLAEETVLG